MDRTRPDALLDPAHLAAMAPYARVLDVRYELGRTDGRAQYLAGHAPGAVFVDLDAELADPVGDGSRGRHPLPGRSDPDRGSAQPLQLGQQGI